MMMWTHSRARLPGVGIIIKPTGNLLNAICYRARLMIRNSCRQSLCEYMSNCCVEWEYGKSSHCNKRTTTKKTPAGKWRRAPTTEEYAHNLPFSYHFVINGVLWAQTENVTMPLTQHRSDQKNPAPIRKFGWLKWSYYTSTLWRIIFAFISVMKD